MKIIHIITGLNTGGAEMALLNLLRGGLAKKFDTHVISLGDLGTIGPKIKKLGVNVTALNMNDKLVPLFGMIRLFKTIAYFRPNIIQGWMYHGNLAASLSSFVTLSKASVVWNVRHSLSDISYEKNLMQLLIRFNKLLSSRADKILYNSFVSKAQHEKFGFFSENSMVIPNGIDLKKFSSSNVISTEVRSNLGIPKSAKVIGHIARLHPMKNHKLFLNVSILLANEYSKLHFIICGKGVPSSEAAKSIPDNVSSRFHLLDESNEIPKLMNAIDIFCLSSSWGEGFPNVLGEAMALKIPCVTTDVGDSKFVVGSAGIVVGVGDKNGLMIGIKDLLEKSPEKFSILGEEARNHIEKNFSLSEIVKKYASLYNDLALIRM